jgi:pseudouridine synthase
MWTDDPRSLRINQFLARAGVASRRGAEALIREGRVTMNGQVVRDLATLVDPAQDAVKVDGRRVHLLKSTSYLALYKPKEVVSTLEDPEGRPCLTGLLPKGSKGLFPVGRLDYHSEGLLLLTTDGELANRLLHPRYKVVKTYHVKVKGDPPYEALERLRRGVVLDGRRTQPVTIRRIPSRETRHAWFEIEMTEGRKNQLREMFFRVEHPVIKLKRVAMGPVRLGKMRPGEVRPLTSEEEEAIKRQAGLIEGAPPPTRTPIRPRVIRTRRSESAIPEGRATGPETSKRPTHGRRASRPPKGNPGTERPSRRKP